MPKDTKQLLANFEGVPGNLLQAVVESNETRKSFIAEEIVKQLEQSGKARKVGIYRLIMKSESDNFRNCAIRGVVERLQERGVAVLVYEPMLHDCKEYEGLPVVEWERFKNESEIVLANRMDEKLKEIAKKVYTRDIFGRD